MINWANFISQCFNGLVLGALLALISSGLTIIYGTLGVLNLAHGIPWEGNYSSWLEQKEKRLALEEKTESARQRTLQHA